MAFVVSCPSCQEENALECKYDAWARFSIVGMDEDGDLKQADEYETQIFDYHEFECSNCGEKFGEKDLIQHLEKLNARPE